MAIAFDKLWVRPQLRDHEQERHATWLELFYDLVFVVAVAELGHVLSTDLSVIGILKFAALFLPVWWAWLHHTFYADRFDPDDPGHRLLTLLQMLAVVTLAASVHGALGETSIEFALSLAVVRVVLVLMFQRARHIEAARPLIRIYTWLFSAGALIWFLSAFVPTPWRYALWTLVMVIEILTISHSSTRRILASLPTSPSHVAERFGLFTIIVLGEAVAGIGGGLIEQNLLSLTTVTAALGLLVAIGIWWVYFENLEEATFRSGLGGLYPFVWVYIHVILVMSITTLGVGVEHAVAEGPGHPLEPMVIWLLVGSLASTFATLAIIHFSDARFPALAQYRSKTILRLGTAVTLVASGFFVTTVGGGPLLLLGLLALLTLIQVASDLFLPVEASPEQVSVSGAE